MKRRISTALLSLLLAFTVWPAGQAVYAESAEVSDGQSLAPAAEEMLESGEYKSNELLVTFNDDVSDKKVEQIIEKKDAETIQMAQVTEDEKIAQVAIAEEDSMEEAIQKFQQDDRVADVQPNYCYQIHATDPYLAETSTSYQYTNDAINAENAWTFLEEGSNQKEQTLIAVLDTGVDVKHEDLQSNLVFSNGKYTQTLGGKETAARDDSGNHGTHVAGIIGATYGNGKGGSGVASGHNNDLVKVMMIGTSSDGMNLYTFDIIKAVQYASSKGAKVISMSFGMNGRDRAQERALIDAYNSGIVLVAASGNDDYSGYGDPGSMKEVISVNASAEDNSPSYFSNYGTFSDIMAPGSNILSTTPGDTYSKFSGTSMATPVVSGVAALMLDANPNLTPQQIYNIICASTGQDEFDRDGKAYGLINAEAAVKAASVAGTEEAQSLYLKEEDGGVTLYEGDDYGLEALVRPAEALPEFTWESSNEDVATVTDNGRVIGVSAGKCRITVRNGSLEKSCAVTVKPSVKVESIKVSGVPEDGEISIGEITALKAKISPASASNTEVYYESKTPKIASVDEEGYVEGLEAGEAVITVYTYSVPADYLNADLSSVRKISTDVTINVKPKATKLSISKSPKWVWVGDTIAYSGTLSDNKGHSKDGISHNKIKWSVNNKSIANIKNDGTLLTKKPGNLYIIAEQILPEKDNSISDLLIFGSEEMIPKATRKLIVAKKNYAGKADYALKNLKYKKKNKVKLSWKANPIASGYQIQFAKKKNGKYKTVKNIKSGKTTKIVLKAKKTGYYRVRAKYQYQGKTKWFGYSNTIKAKPYTKKKK